LLVREEFLPKVEKMGVFKGDQIAADDETTLKIVMQEILKDGREKRFGSFFKKGSTSIKVLKQKEVYMFVAYQAMQSELVLQAGDVVLFQDLGDLI
jgi:hypothetical protein